jgi:magnesium-transporting ATPase (P-type)
VIHDGKEKVIDATELVIGDIIYIRSSKRVPADIRLLVS